MTSNKASRDITIIFFLIKKLKKLRKIHIYIISKMSMGDFLVILPSDSDIDFQLNNSLCGN